MAERFSYYHCNQQYSIYAVTNVRGSIVERYAYTAYGQPTITDASGTTLGASSIDNRYMYTGREWDAEIEIYHYWARMYDPLLKIRIEGPDRVRGKSLESL